QFAPVHYAGDDSTDGVIPSVTGTLGLRDCHLHKPLSWFVGSSDHAGIISLHENCGNILDDFGGTGRTNHCDVTTSRPTLLAPVVTNAHASPFSSFKWMLLLTKWRVSA